MIITGSKNVITKIYLKDKDPIELEDSIGLFLTDSNNKPLYSKPPNEIVAIYKGQDLIWLTTYLIEIRSCYGSGVWLDNYNWIDNDTWKN